MFFRLPAAVVCLLYAASAQHRVDPANTYFRLVCVVPMVGSGTPADPKRPQYAPLPPSPGTPPSRAGILAAGYLTSDDGKYALVEFVAADRAAFAPILADKQVKAFEKGKAKKADIEAEFRRHKKELKLEQLIVRVP